MYLQSVSMMPKGIFYADLRLANYLNFEVPLRVFDRSGFKAVIPELSLVCCATGEVYGQLLDSFIGMASLFTLNRRGW